MMLAASSDIAVSSPVPILCGSCLRVRFFGSAMDAAGAVCACGKVEESGEGFCWCLGCQRDAWLLLGGCRDMRLLDLGDDCEPLAGWSADGGIVLTTAPPQWPEDVVVPLRRLPDCARPVPT